MARRRNWELSISRMICFNRMDAGDFGRALQAEFPGILFVPHNYWLIERPMIAADGQVRVTWEPAGRRLSRRSGLDDPDCRWFEAWYAPPGWEPEFESLVDVELEEFRKRHGHVDESDPDVRSIHQRFDGCFRVPIRPRLRFSFSRSEPHPWHGTAGSIPPSMISTVYSRRFPERALWFRRVLRIVEAFSNPTMVVVNQENQIVKGPLISPYLVGLHTRKWAREDPGRRIDRVMRPTDDDTPWRKLTKPRRTFTPT